MSKVLFEKDGRIGRITLNRPYVLNAIDHDVPSLLADFGKDAEADEGIRVIVLSGAGRAVCAPNGPMRFLQSGLFGDFQAGREGLPHRL